MLVKSLNVRHGVEDYRIVLFPTAEPEDLMLEHLQFAANALKNIDMLCNIMFFHDASESNQGV
jgi:hypothetical protein